MRGGFKELQESADRTGDSRPAEYLRQSTDGKTQACGDRRGATFRPNHNAGHEGAVEKRDHEVIGKVVKKHEKPRDWLSEVLTETVFALGNDGLDGPCRVPQWQQETGGHGNHCETAHQRKQDEFRILHEDSDAIAQKSETGENALTHFCDVIEHGRIP